MDKIIPNKLKIGDEIRVIAPSRSMCILNKDLIESAKSKLEKIGFKVSFGKNVSKSIDDNYKCASIEDRVQDLHEAFADKNVKAILTVIGGYNVNQILDYIDYELIKENPKILCGFSDITALSNTIYAKTGLVTYSGPHFSSFGMKKGFEYTREYFEKMFMQREKILIESSEEWSNDSWFKDQENRIFMKNNNTNQGTLTLTENRSGIITHPREIMDLRELFVILTYHCNGNCEYCIERNVHKKGFLTDYNFEKALSFANEKGLTTIFLHGGEPSIHPNIVDYAKKAKNAGFLVKMFTNGIAIEKIRQLDGILDEIIFSYRGEYSLHNQKDWTTPLSLQVLVTEAEFPTLQDLKAFIVEKSATGMKLRIHTLNPVNQYSYDNQYVSYLEDMFMQLPDDEIYCASNKVMMSYEGVGIRLTNKSLNPSHLKYSMSPSGEIQTNFKRYFNEIVKNERIEILLQKSQEKLVRLREDKTPIPLDKVLGFY